jgi:hypothetical protein
MKLVYKTMKAALSTGMWLFLVWLLLWWCKDITDAIIY